MTSTPAHLFTADPPGSDPDFENDDHRRVLARCNVGHPIGFSTLHDQLARDPFAFGINENDQARLGVVLGELMADGDVIQHLDGSFEASEDGWEKVTHIKANDALRGRGKNG